MAKMWPKTLPDWVTQDERRTAEVTTYNKLKSELDDGWSVFYSCPWRGITPRGSEKEGEADFIVIHPEMGLLFIEVKGGGVSWDPDTDKWTTTNRNKITFAIKDPVKQATDCKHQFLRKLKNQPGWPPFFIRFRHGVIFPDCREPPHTTTQIGKYDREFFCFQRVFQHGLGNWVHDRLSAHHNSNSSESGPGESGCKIIEKFLVDPLVLRVPLECDLNCELREMDGLLTGAQFTIMHMMDLEPRTLVEGGAGTGKTVVATELAAKYASESGRVLFCCNGMALAQTIAKKLAGYPNVTVRTFTMLLAEINQGNFDTYTHIIIDEGQDFHLEWWDKIENLLHKNGKLRVFADSNQAVYRRRDDLETRLCAKSLPPLGINLRNTVAIAHATSSLYRGPVIKAYGPKGESPQCEAVDFNKALELAKNKLYQLLRAKEVSPQMVTFLLPSRYLRDSTINEFNKRGIAAANAVNRGATCVVVETVSEFKGLESPLVILVADRNTANNMELAYVAISRARSRLFIFGSIQGTKLEKSVMDAKA